MLWSIGSLKTRKSRGYSVSLTTAIPQKTDSIAYTQIKISSKHALLKEIRAVLKKTKKNFLLMVKAVEATDKHIPKFIPH